MIWLWSAGPLVVVGAALWLAVGTRRLVQQRRGLVEERTATFADASAPLRARTADLDRAIGVFEARTVGDTDAGGPGR